MKKILFILLSTCLLTSSSIHAETPSPSTEESSIEKASVGNGAVESTQKASESYNWKAISLFAGVSLIAVAVITLVALPHNHDR